MFKYIEIDNKNKVISILGCEVEQANPNLIDVSSIILDNDENVINKYFIDNKILDKNPNSTLDESKIEKKLELKLWHDKQIYEMRSKYSQGEIDSFTDKRKEAMAWRVDNTIQTPYISAMVGGDETLRITMIHAILVKVDELAQLEFIVQQKRDEISLCDNVEALNSIII